MIPSAGPRHKAFRTVGRRSQATQFKVRRSAVTGSFYVATSNAASHWKQTRSRREQSTFDFAGDATADTFPVRPVFNAILGERVDRVLTDSIRGSFGASWWERILDWDDRAAARWYEFALLQHNDYNIGAVAIWGGPSDEPDLSGVRDQFESQDWDGVTRFLSVEPWLTSTLRALVAPARAAFGASSTLWLDVLDDPNGGPPQLVATVSADLPPLELLTRLRALDEAWWREAAPATRGRLLVTV